MKLDSIGVVEVLCNVSFAHLPQEAVLDSIRLLGERVIPELRRRGASRISSTLEQSISGTERAQTASQDVCWPAYQSYRDGLP